VLTRGFLGHVEAPGDLGVGMPSGDQAQQFPLPGGEPGDGVAAAFGVQVGLVQVGAQQRPVPFGEVRAGPSPEDHADGAQVPGGQAQQHFVLMPHRRISSLYMPVLCHCRTE